MGACFFDVGSCNTQQKSHKNRRKFACFLGRQFWEDLEAVFGGFWETKIVDFRVFFDIFFDVNFELGKPAFDGGRTTSPRGGGLAPTREQLSGPGPPTRVFLVFTEEH